MKKIEKLLAGNGNNYLFPFLWLHGEEEAVLREYMKVIDELGIRAVCVESRPHPDYCGPKWWQDMDVILDEARKRNMKVWILDDSHFPTGYANGAMKNAPQDLCRQSIYYSAIEVVGPMKSVQLNIAKHGKYTPNPFKANPLSVLSRGQKRYFDDDKIISVVAVRIDNGMDESTTLDLSYYVQEENLLWDVPVGKWRIYICFLTRNAGSRGDYINMLTEKSVHKLIEAVYIPHWEHYHADFGKTIAGFFSDEPELGNGQPYDKNSVLGSDNDFPWSSELEEGMKKRLGEQWKLKLPLLWHDSKNEAVTAQIRYTYMDVVTRLVESDFSKQLGNWCKEHNVEYIGHLIEDNNMHARLGPSLGHFYRGLSGQHMSGIDNIGGQVVPAGEMYPDKQIFGDRDGEFYHYVLAKLGSSFGAIDPQKKGRTMCEIFGAYGWSLGVRNMKYLIDHFLVRGVNHFVPHAFSCKAYPDPDCPPHFYANGHDPQIRHFGYLMQYTNRMCELISDGYAITPVAMLYHAEGEWTGQYMLNQKIAHVLADHQIDFDILPADVFEEKQRYHTDLDSGFLVNGKRYKIFLIPYTEFVTYDTIEACIKMKKSGFPFAFIHALPVGIVGQNRSNRTVSELLEELHGSKIVDLDNLAEWLKDIDIPEIILSKHFPLLRYIHYKSDRDVYVFTNENMMEVFEGEITIPIQATVYQYDAWENKVELVESKQTLEGTIINLKIPSYKSVVIFFDEVEDFKLNEKPIMTRTYTSNRKKNLRENLDQIELSMAKLWTVSIAKAIEYPYFSNAMQTNELENIGLFYPEFSGIIRYENEFELPNIEVDVMSKLLIDDAFEGVEVFINDTSTGVQIAPPFEFDISKYVIEGRNSIKIEVATNLERENHYSPKDPNDFFANLLKSPALSPIGIIGEVKISYQR